MDETAQRAAEGAMRSSAAIETACASFARCELSRVLWHVIHEVMFLARTGRKTSMGRQRRYARQSCFCMEEPDCKLRQGGRGLGRLPMMRRLLVGIGELEQRRLVIGAPEERDADRQVIAREPGGHGDGRSVNQERVQRQYAAGARIGRVVPSLMVPGWNSTDLCTMASSLLSAITLKTSNVSFSRASRNARYLAGSSGGGGFVHWSALDGGKLLPISGERAMSSRVLIGESGLRAR